MNKIPRHYIKAIGSTCYNRQGVSEGDCVRIINWNQMPGIYNPHWANQFGWSNQPAVLTFQLTDKAKAEAWLATQCPTPGLPCLLITDHWANPKECEACHRPSPKLHKVKTAEDDGLGSLMVCSKCD